MKFRNPTNGYTEEKQAPWLFTLLFGGLYFIGSGLWAPLLIWGIITILLYASMGAPATVFVFAMDVIFAMLANGLVRASYLRKGWEQVIDAVPADGSPRAPLAPLLDTGYKKCPFCAETVRAEAAKCKHCGSDLTQTTALS